MTYLFKQVYKAIRRIWRIMLFLCISMSIWGQEDLLFHSFTMSEGFPHTGASYQNGLVKDHRGFLWVATTNGLVRFDGLDFEHFVHDEHDANSLPDNILTVVHEGPDHRIWIGSVSRGVMILDPLTRQFTSLGIPNALREKGTDPLVWFFETDRNGNIWYGTQIGLVRVDPATHRQTCYLTDYSGIRSGFIDESGQLYVGSEQGLHRYDQLADSFRVFPFPDTEKTPSISQMVRGLDESLWLLGTRDPILTFNPQSRTFSRHANPVHPHIPRQIETDSSGGYWIHHNMGLSWYDPATDERHDLPVGEAYPTQLPSHQLGDILLDEQGYLFATTWFDGIAYAKTGISPFTRLGDFQSRETLPLPNDRLLIRDQSRGGIVMDLQTGILETSSLPMTPATIFYPTLALAGDSLLFIHEGDYISEYHLPSGRSRVVPGSDSACLFIAVDPRGRLWNGLSYLDSETGTWKSIKPDLAKVFPEFNALQNPYVQWHFDDRNRVFLSVQDVDGIIRHDLSDGQSKRYNTDVSTFSPGRDGRFYGVGPGGLSIYDPVSDTFHTLTQADGLIGVPIAVINDRFGNTWVGTTRGLLRLEWSDTTFHQINAFDGLPAKDNSPIRHFSEDPSGNLYFDLDMEQLVAFGPKKLRPNRDTQALFLSQFHLDREPVDPYKHSELMDGPLEVVPRIDLPYTQDHFGFSYTLPFFYKPDQVNFEYRLSPYHKTWQSNGFKRSVHFMNMRPGTYVFQVRAITASGTRINPTEPQTIHIAPPWWATWWAYLLYATGGISLVIAAYRFQWRRNLEKQERKRLQEIHEVKNTLFANITHELRTPLTVILGMAEQITDQHKKSLILRNGNQLLGFINDMLDLSRLDAGLMTATYQRGNIISYVHYLIESFHLLAHQKQVSLLCSPEIDSLEMDYNEKIIRQILTNLIANAIKHSKRGDTVQVGLAPKNGTMLILSVSDTGEGIPPNQVDRIFDRFFQVTETDNPTSGSGLGLALTRDLVQLMGGNIQARSTLGQGTTMEVELPLRQEGSELHDLTTAHDTDWYGGTPTTQAPFAKSTRGTNDKQLLLIEDNLDVSNYITELLAGDYEILFAPNGQQGMELASKHLPDIIISDIMMPNKNGFEVTQWLKSHAATSHIPIILLTARAEKKDRIQGIEHGADAYLIKPFSPQELTAQIKNLIQQRQRWQKAYQLQQLHGDLTQTSPFSTLDDDFLKTASRYIHQYLDDASLKLDDIAAALQLSPNQFYRKVKALTGQSPSLFVRRVRLLAAKELIVKSSEPISQIAYRVGFTDPAYFSRAFREEFDQTPSKCREGG
jgi:signal transduction histidine kinase/AraC-like DNA-binding protein/ligand-binding sensor domain-containing protein